MGHELPINPLQWSQPSTSHPLLQPQHLAAQIQILRQSLRWAHVRHLPTFERDCAIRKRKREIEVVIDDQDRDLASKLVERLEQLLDHGRSEALERLVE